MIEYGKVIAFLLLFAIMSTALYYVLERDKINAWAQYIRITIASFLNNYFIMSLVKMIIYASDVTLIDSFWSDNLDMYIKYGIILFVFSVLYPVVLKFVLKEKHIVFVNIFDAVMFVFLTSVFILEQSLNNGLFCIGFIVGIVISLIYTLAIRKMPQYINKENFKASILGIVPAICAWVVTVVVFLPNELWLDNYGELPGRYDQFALITIVGGVLICVILILFAVIGTIILPTQLYKVYSLLLSSLICIGYLQGMVMNGKLKVMDGDMQEWSKGTLAVNSIIWIVLILLFVCLAYIKPFIFKIGKTICIYITLIQALALCILLIRTDYRLINTSEAMTTEGALELSNGNNVLVFVLDRFESSWFEDVIQEGDYLKEEMSDFTYYNNATSQFLHTDNAIPYLLTGVTWDENIDGDYKEYAYDNSDAIENISEAGYDIGIYTAEAYLSKDVKELASNYEPEIENTFEPIKTLKLMVKTSMYKIAPFILKQWYIYYSGALGDLSILEGEWTINDDLPFYNMLINDGLKINNDIDNSFRFYHMYGTHSPYHLSEDLKYESRSKKVTRTEQGIGCLKIVSEYLEQMKELGIYDSATIIITADHGQASLLNSDKDSGKPDDISSPLFLVKLPYAESETMSVCNAPVSQQELMPTIMASIGVDKSEYGSGRCFDEIGENESRERNCVDIWSNYVIQYTINGDVRDLNSWNIENVSYNN
jgi:hypothetical protein